MRLLLDTHIAIWTAIDPQSLNAAERRVLEEAAEPPVLSTVSVWELRLQWRSLHHSGVPKGRVAPEAVVAIGAAFGWTFLPLTHHHAAAALSYPLHHKDPFDELLLVQAQEEGLRLLTRDTRLLAHPLPCPTPPR